jgi:hypothetical protein
LGQDRHALVTPEFRLLTIREIASPFIQNKALGAFKVDAIGSCNQNRFGGKTMKMTEPNASRRSVRG